MKKPSPENVYVHRCARVLFEPATRAQRLNAVITLVQTTKATLREITPETVMGTEAALTGVLRELKRLVKEFDGAAEWMASHTGDGPPRYLM